ncbi:MAG: Na+/H+ antiporter NhaA [Acidimicrobiia bacterium]
MSRLRRLAPAPVSEFLRTDAGAGVLLLLATVGALVWANSPARASYDSFWHHELVVGPGSLAVAEDLRHWVNDALMAVFFFLVGLEIKREVVTGELRDRRAALVPVVAAAGGMAVPALVFLAVAGGGEAARGWGIPMATDIAFAVGILAALGDRAPNGLRVFLLSLAIVDDIGAILVIALFYAEGIAFSWLAGAAGAFTVVLVLRRAEVSQPLAYLPAGVAVWYCTYRTGIHPTIAAVALGALVPARPVRGRPVMDRLEHRLHPWSRFLVVPVFALANAGIALSADTLSGAAGSRLTWAVALGLVAGKLAGIGTAATVAVRLGLGRLPSDVDLGHIWGAAALGGIGFTVSLFVTGLAFEQGAAEDQAKIGILVGSAVAALLGALVLLRRSAAPG